MYKTLAKLTIFLTAITASLNAQELIDPTRFFDIAKIQILDKTTAKSIDKEIKINETYDFGNIKIKIHKCWQAPLNQRPDSKILMEVSEKKQLSSNAENNRIFFGWMIASSPSISGLQHPVYDIMALNCKNSLRSQQ